MNSSASQLKILAALLMCFGFMLSLSACTSSTSTIESTPNNTVEKPFTVQVLGINDFHGQVLPKNEQGGMYNLASHLLGAVESTPDHTFIVHAGDHVGASPAESALLQDEPSITFLNYIEGYCTEARQQTCKVIGTAGNHEFDEGTEEMLRLLKGGNHNKGPFLASNWQGATYTNLSANVFVKNSGNLLLPPYVIHQVNGVDIGFIGITLDHTPELVVPGMIEDVYFADQAKVAQHYAKLLTESGVNAIVIVVHDGTTFDYYSGKTRKKSKIDRNTEFGQFLAKLPNTIDLVVTGHSHRFTNAFFDREDAPALLVTQAFSSGQGYADITLTIDPNSRDITKASGEVIMVENASSTNLSQQAKSTLDNLQDLIIESVEYAKAYTHQLINVYQPARNEIQLGEFIANSHQYILKTDIAIMNQGGVRASLKPGEITWGSLFAVQPFSNQLIVRQYSGTQLLALIEDTHYWSSDIVLDANKKVTWRGQPIEAGRTYTLGGNAYIMNSDKFSVGQKVRVDILDIDATSTYIKALEIPFSLLSKPD